MARVEIILPESFSFETDVEIQITQINLAKHLGNHDLVGILNEARTRYFHSINYQETTGRGLINADLAVVYKSEAKYGETLKIKIATSDFQKYGCDFVYRVSDKATGRLVAEAKTAMLMFDYETGKLAEVSAGFRDIFMAGQ
ncbi:thioesterase [Endozoicomonas sp. OPT23]|uniref:acyl-CoA thioesterase n=1 Tax=Endozoicomonas sp. OPT23 TaxID=2072845 RepID=UPI00129B9C46|nr:thioesterase family protein [Endozoicomonas sp. OPT23]MRI35485.1 thioesterase [Endozoicomonas sp. OPT23]